MLGTKDEVLTTMAGSFGYAAPEVMLKQGHGKAVDMWSLGIITYTLLCGYAPFRSENLQDLIDECSACNVVFHERYWKDVSNDAKDFILKLLRSRAEERWTSEVRPSLSPSPSPSPFPSPSFPLSPPPSFPLFPLTNIPSPPIQQALAHPWLSGENATDHNLLPEIRAYLTRARLRRGIEMVKLANRIEALKMQEEDPENSDMPKDATLAADRTRHFASSSSDAANYGSDSATSATTNRTVSADEEGEGGEGGKRKLSKAIKGAIFREVVLAKVREMKEQEETLKVTEEATQEAKRKA